jgi:hypothetical protein
MPKFLILYRSTAEAGEQMAAATPEQAQEGMQMWMKWAEKAGPALVDLGSPLGGSRTVGGSAQSGTPIGGFSVLEADSTDAVAALLDDHPHLHSPGAAIEVLEYLPMPGM